MTLALLALLLAPNPRAIGVAAGARAQERSPAQGHAQVIAQGVAAMPADSVVWRAVRGLAPPAAEAPLVELSLGFLLAEGGPVLASGEGEGDQTRLAPGEALLVSAGARQRWASTGPEAADYYGLELVDAVADAGGADAAEVVASGDPFAAPPGRRDLDLVRDVVAPGETSRLAGSDAPALLLVPAGTVRVEAADNPTRTLTAGDGAVLSGALTVTATGIGAARFVAAVIGPAVNAAPDAVTATDAAPAAGVDLPPPPMAEGGGADAEGNPPPQTDVGAIAVTLSACPLGMRPETFVAAACAPAADVVDLQVFVRDGGTNFRTLADATEEDDAFVWSGLPVADYLLRTSGFAPGYDRFLVPGLDGIPTPPELGYSADSFGGYLIPLAAEPSPVRLVVFAFREPPGTPLASESATLGLFLNTCAPGVVAVPDMTGADCTRIDLLASGFDVVVSGDGLATPLTLATSELADAAGRVWERVPLGAYTVTATLPPGIDGYALRPGRAGFELTLLADGTGYAFTLTENLFDPGDDVRRVNIEAYLLTS